MGFDGSAKILLAAFGEESEMQQKITVDRNLSIVPTIPERSNALSVGTNELWAIAGLTDTSLNALSVGTNLSFRLFVSFEEQLDVRGWSVRPPLDSTEVERKKGDIAVETAEKSPLLALAGTLECDLSAIEPAPVPKMREVPQDPELAKHATTPLLALAGTLECDVPDIGKRHDEYIGDALLAELRGDHDE